MVADKVMYIFLFDSVRMSVEYEFSLGNMIPFRCGAELLFRLVNKKWLHDHLLKFS